MEYGKHINMNNTIIYKLFRILIDSRYCINNPETVIKFCNSMFKIEMV